MRLTAPPALCFWVAHVLWCAGCQAPTEIVLVVQTDLAVPNELDAIEITIDGRAVGAGTTLTDANELPLSLGISGAAGRPPTVLVTGRAGGSSVVEVDAGRIPFRPNERVIRYVFLGRDSRHCELLWDPAFESWEPSDRCAGVGDAGPLDAGLRDASGAPDAGSSSDAAVGDDAAVGADASPDAGALECETGCDDGDVCTVDNCVGGICVHEPGPNGVVCGTENRTQGACVLNEDCSDGRAEETTTTFTCVSGACAADTVSRSVPCNTDGLSCGGLAQRCCDSSCVDVSTNRDHCGGCGNFCPVGVCNPSPDGSSGRCPCTVGIGPGCDDEVPMCVDMGTNDMCLCRVGSSDCSPGQTCGSDQYCRY